MATITTTIGAGDTHDSDINIASSSGSGPYSVTVDSTSGAVLGDALWDEGGPPSKHLILAVVNSTTLTTLTNPSAEGFATAEIKRFYNGSTPITDWEAGLDSSSIYSSSDAAVGNCYSDAGFDEKVSLNGGGTISLASATLSVASGERHDGTSGSGATINSTSAGAILDIARTGFAYKIEWLEITQSGFSPGSVQNFGIKFEQDDDPVIRNMLIYGVVGATHTGRPAIGIGTGGSRALPEITNCMIFNNGGGTSTASGGIGINANAASAAVGILNCTVHDNLAVGSYGGIGLKAVGSNLDARNCISTDNDNNDYDGTFGTEDYNLSSDATAVGTDLDSKSSADQFVSNSSYDLHLKSGADAIDAGTDLGTAANVDIDGFDRHAVAIHDPWDCGCHELQSVAGLGIPIAAYHHFHHNLNP